MEEVKEILTKLDEIKEAIHKSTIDELLSRKDVEEQYGLSTQCVARIFKAKGSPIINLGRKQKIARSSLEEILKAGITIRTGR